MLGAAKEALTAAQNNAQAADQQSRELMGLYSWAGTSGGSGAGRGTKVEIFQDPGSYDSSPSKFKEWWTKMNAWLECHLKQFQEKDMQGHDVPALKQRMYTVLSQLKGLKGAHYAKIELKKLTNGKSLHQYWELFATEIKGVFCPQLQQDWARNVLKKLKQTDNMSTVTFIVELMKLKYYAKTDDGTAIRYLEDNIHPQICYQLFSMGQHSSDYNATLIAIKEIGTNLEVYRMYTRTGQEASPSKTLNQVDSAEIGLGPGAEEDIGALSWDEKKKGKGKGNMPQQNNKCFNCRTEGHSIKDCRKPKNQCNKCKLHGGGHRANCSKYVTKVRASTTEQTMVHSAPSIAKDPFTTIQGMDFEQMQAVRNASLTQTFSFLPASWVGDTHEETDVLPISDREEMR